MTTNHGEYIELGEILAVSGESFKRYPVLYI